MAATDLAGAMTIRLRAHEERSRAKKLRREAATNRRRTNAICDRLAVGLLETSSRPYGDRGERFLLRLGSLQPLLRFARNDFRHWLESKHLPAEVVDDATLACSEACANALEHPSRSTRQRIEIEARRNSAELLLRVRDYGSWTRQNRSDFRGRGIAMIRQLMDAVEIHHRPTGTEIVMRRQLRIGACSRW
jgi:anti-sigma regulatory factor (Ser/Thr protein kinase)